MKIRRVNEDGSIEYPDKITFGRHYLLGHMTDGEAVGVATSHPAEYPDSKPHAAGAVVWFLGDKYNRPAEERYAVGSGETVCVEPLLPEEKIVFDDILAQIKFAQTVVGAKIERSAVSDMINMRG